MKRFMTILSVLAILAMGTSAHAVRFGWTISGSAADPYVNTGTATNGVVNLTLWLVCTDGTLGMASAEFDLVPQGTMSVLAFTALPPFLNAGGATNLLLAVGGCPPGPLPAGTVLILDTPGGVCFGASAANGLITTVECSTLALGDMEYIGYDNSGTGPCMEMAGDNLCDPVSVEDDSWGSIKSLYR
jgi:hypothetical protein